MAFLRFVPPTIVVTSLLAATGCQRAVADKTDRAPIATASGAPASSVPAAAPIASKPAAAPASACAIEGAPATIAIKAKSQDVRIGALGAKALVTWLEPANNEGGGRRALGRVFDGTTLEPEGVLDQSQYGDVILSGSAPLALGGELVAIGCENYAPTGVVSCSTQAPGAKPKNLFQVQSVNFGAQGPGVAVVTSGKDALVFMPHGKVTTLSTRAGGSKRTHNGLSSKDVETLTATLASDDEAVVVYREGGVLFARRAGWDEKWKTKPTALSEPAALVGAPAIASTPSAGPGAVTAWFSTRKTAKDPWQIVAATWTGAGVTRAAFESGGEQVQGPAVASTGDPRCVLLSWVEGTGDKTVTRIARSCDGRVDRASATQLSASGIEGGRAAIARTDLATFVVWQEFPKGSASELKVARLACR